MKNGLAHCYHLGEYTVILGASAVILKFHSIFDEIHDDSLTTAPWCLNSLCCWRLKYVIIF